MKKNQIIITLTNLDDFTKTMEGLDNLLDYLIKYYVDTNLSYCKTLVLALSVYLGQILDLTGWDIDDLKGKDEN